MKQFIKWVYVKNSFMKEVINYIYMFIYEYMSNHIINMIPNAKFRRLFYKNVLRIDMSKSTYIHMGVYIYPEIKKMHIGKYTIINRKCILDRRGGLSIGNNVNISSEAAFYTAGHLIDSPEFEYYSKPVVIEDYVWVGTRAMIMPGVIVGKGAMIMPGAIVTKNVEPYEIVAGVPAKKVGERDHNLKYNLTWRSMFL